MSNKITTVIMLVLAGLLAYSVFFKPDNTNELKEYWESKSFKTDTVEVKVDYSQLPKPIYKNYVPPAVVVNYVDSTKTINNHKQVIVSNDSLLQVIDSLQNEITEISLDYIRRYPSSPKLIYGEYSGDTARFDLLEIDGQIRTYKYGVNYTRFGYQWLSSADFRAHTITRTTFSELLEKSTLYGNAGYSFTLAKPFISMDYSLYKRRYRLDFDTRMTLENSPVFRFDVGLGYKIK